MRAGKQQTGRGVMVVVSPAWMKTGDMSNDVQHFFKNCESSPTTTNEPKVFDVYEEKVQVG